MNGWVTRRNPQGYLYSGFLGTQFSNPFPLHLESAHFLYSSVRQISDGSRCSTVADILVVFFVKPLPDFGFSYCSPDRPSGFVQSVENCARVKGRGFGCALTWTPPRGLSVFRCPRIPQDLLGRPAPLQT
ncbi:unnamed protein product [Ixodes pacificus]